MKITEQIQAIKIPFQIPVAPGRTIDRFVYSYVIYGEKICLIDSGVASSERIIFDYIRNSNRTPEEISLMILTHAHPDHIGSAKAIKEVTHCTVAAHENARRWIEDIDLQFQERPVPGFHSLVGGSVPIERLLRNGEQIDLGNISLEILHTPGHSEDSISLFSKETGVLFVGDAIPQRNDLPIYNDAAASAASLNRLRDMENIRFLLASWSDPKAGAEAYRMIADSLDYLQEIHHAVLKIHDENILNNPMALCRKMVDIPGLPEIAVNPLVAKSFASHLSSNPINQRRKA